MIHPLWFLPLLVFLSRAALGAAAPPSQTDFPPQEFQERRQKLLEKIGEQALALVPGSTGPGGFILPRQTNEFYYLSGLETPHSYLVLDGRTRKATLLLPPRDARLESAEGRVLSAEDAVAVKDLTGVDEVLSTAAMTVDWMRALLGGSSPAPGPSPAIYIPFTPAEGGAECRDELQRANAAIASDPWDGRPSRESRLVELLRTRFPRSEVRDLTPILDDLRSVKSPREVALIRKASRLAGRGLLAAMRSTRPGTFEYQLEAAARYVFLVNGARREAYRSITAAGTANIGNMHYYRNSDQLGDGDLVLMDYSPEWGYYASDIARMWPVNGKFSPDQRELLQPVLSYRNAVLKRIRPGVTAEAIQEEARSAMDEILTRTRFSKPIYEAAARRLVNTGGGVFSHPVGMAVHDDGAYRRGPLKPGQVFSIDPQLRVPEEGLYLRFEDVVVVTADGVENFTEFLPSELEDIEKLVGQGGIVERFPPEPAGPSSGGD